MDERTLYRSSSRVKAYKTPITSIINTSIIENMSLLMGSDNRSPHKEQLTIKHEGVPVVFDLEIIPNDWIECDVGYRRECRNCVSLQIRTQYTEKCRYQTTENQSLNCSEWAYLFKSA